MSTTGAKYTARMDAQRAARSAERAARLAGATPSKSTIAHPITAAPSPSPFVPDGDAICRSFRAAALPGAQPIPAIDYQALATFHTAEMQRLSTVAAVSRIRQHAGLDSPPISDVVKRIARNAVGICAPGSSFSITGT
jgi:hypothetical protein